MPTRYRVRAALLCAAIVVLAGCGGSDGDGGASTSTPKSTDTTSATATTATAATPELGAAIDSIAALPGALKSGPPWPANNGAPLQLRMRAVGLQPLSEEGQVLHIHQHLDIYVEGRKATVPANLGIDAGGAFISDLHTHDSSGIMHVESPAQRDFTLGQYFAVWGLPLTADCVGSLCEKGSKTLRVWVNGDEVSADPTRIVLAEHQVIVIAHGTAAQVPDPLPTSFDFAAAGL